MDSIKEVQSGNDTEIFRDSHAEEPDYKRKKYVALYQARTIICQIGKMSERAACRKELKLMKKKGLAYFGK